MEAKYEVTAASALLGIAAFKVWEEWRETAPTISDMRTSSRDDIQTRQKLLDAEITVGGMVLVIGTIYGYLTRDIQPLIIMLVVFCCVAWLHHWILDADNLDY